MSAVGTGGWRVVSVSDTGANARTVVVSAPGPQGPAGEAAGGGLLSTLADVSVSAASEGDLLTFDSALSAWTNSPRDTITDGGNF